MIVHIATKPFDGGFHSLFVAHSGKVGMPRLFRFGALVQQFVYLLRGSYDSITHSRLLVFDTIKIINNFSKFEHHLTLFVESGGKQCIVEPFDSKYQLLLL